jgi:iron complex outermembrane recepter protein
MKNTLGSFLLAAALLPIIAVADDADETVRASKPDQSADELQEVVVTGIKQSLEAAIDLKRNADSFIDAINAEDVGKLPDANLAEVMQRVPGVAIQRTRGEGDFISIRGLGPDFVTGEIDGRTLVSATESSDWIRNGGVFSSTGRSTNFDVLPAEIVDKLEVIKSPTASMIEGGIGGMVNILTQEPLKLGDHFFFSATDEYRQLNDKEDPSLSGLASWKNESGTFGVLADAAYSRRSIREDGMDSYGWATPSNFGAWPNINSTGAGSANLVGDNSAWTVQPRQDTEIRERATGEIKAQWQTPDGGLLTGSVLYSHRTSDLTHMSATINIAPTAFVNPPPSLVPPGLSGTSTLGNCAVNPVAGGFCTVPGATAANGSITSLQVSSSATDNYEVQQALDTLTTTGLNYRKSFGPLSVAGDVSYTSALGTMLDTTENAQSAYVTPWNFSTTSNSLQISPVGDPDLSSGSDFYTRGISTTSRRNQQSEKAAALDAQLDVDQVPLTSAIEFGVRWTERDVDRKQYIDPNPHNDNILLTGYNGVSPTSNFGSGAFTLPFSQFYFVPISTFESALQTADPAGNASFAPTEFDSLNSYSVQEDTYALYIQDDLRTELFHLPLKGNIGLRGVETRTSTTGYYQPFTIEFNQQDLGNLVYTSSEIQSTDFKNSYFNLLPELNLQLDVRDDLLVRFAAGKSMTRPDFQTQLAPALTGINAQNKIASAGNPYLKAYTSNNVDLGVEWYPAAATALWATVYSKWIDNFIGESTEFDATRFNYTWNSLNTPENQGKAKIQGAEVGYQQVWPIGVGYMVNATLATSSANYTSGVNAGKELPFEGVSRQSFNGALFYEQSNFNARLAYSYRASYVLIASDVFGNTEYNAPYGQLDGSISYAINANLTVVADATNLTDSWNRIYTIRPGDPLSYTEVGRRFSLGVRGRF